MIIDLLLVLDWPTHNPFLAWGCKMGITKFAGGVANINITSNKSIIMRKIPEKMKEEIAALPFMERCCITGSYNVSWEHSFTYGKKQINEIWAINPLDRELNTSHPPREAKERCQLISLLRATPEELSKYPKKNWEQIKKYLQSKYPDQVYNEVYQD